MDLQGLREIVGPETAIHYDASHTLGLIAGGAWQQPLAEGADTLGGSTHKTYPGPHKGLLATNDAGLAARLDEHASYFVSHHHPADVVALAVAAAEMETRGHEYAHATVANARRLGAALAGRGFTVCGEKAGFTDCHQLWIDIAPLMDAEEASRRLFEAGIVVNAIPLPHITAPAGLRLGVQELTWAGMRKEGIDELAEVFTAVLRDGQDPAHSAARTRALAEALALEDGPGEHPARRARRGRGRRRRVIPEQIPGKGTFLGPVHTTKTFEIRPDCRHFASRSSTWPPAAPPPVKTRVRADDSTLLRFDTDADPLPLGPLPDAARTRLADAAAVLVCDYGRGITSHDGLRQALTAAAGDRPLVWDPHPKGTTPTPGTALAVPNTDEALRFTGHDGPRSLAGDTARAIQLLAAWPVKQVAVIRGRDGAVLVADADGHPLAVPARPAAGDTCGAGDQLAVTAAMTLAAGRLPSHAIAAAVNAATDYVAAGGPATPATHEPSDTTGPLELAARVRARGGRVVGAGGCFDLLHAGHLSLLNHARRLGDVLIVCINSDASVRRLKGADRPVVGERERAALLTALDCVDHVPVFAEDTPEKVLAELRPDVWGKGGDYAGQRIAEADLVESWGGEVVTVPFLEGHSTTTRIRHLAQQAGAR
ncbi:PfkB family carbohydrate kinase [Streptomyces olivaceoviridis]|uniref:PfkB family carbohydrate kinase n=1 Tax=Streptomyces olivaceoviridis TaxID=1921 RepID=UPI00332DD9F2